MFFHLKIAVVILLVTSGVGVAVNAMRTTTKIEPSKFVSNRPVANDTPASMPASGPASQPADPHTATLDDVKQAMQSGIAFFIDARKPEEYAAGHIKGAINLPLTALFEHLDFVIRNVPSTELVIVYCGGGNCEASHVVADALRNQAGFINVKVYLKGWEELLTSPQFAELTEVSP